MVSEVGERARQRAQAFLGSPRACRLVVLLPMPEELRGMAAKVKAGHEAALLYGVPIERLKPRMRHHARILWCDFGQSGLSV